MRMWMLTLAALMISGCAAAGSEIYPYSDSESGWMIRSNYGLGGDRGSAVDSLDAISKGLCPHGYDRLQERDYPRLGGSGRQELDVRHLAWVIRCAE